jgi:HEAT repeat protein
MPGPPASAGDQPQPVADEIATGASGVPLVTLAALDRLLGGTFEERLALVDDISPWLDPAIYSGSDHVIRIVTEDLAAWLDQETDDWLRYRLLFNVYEESDDELDPLFRKALQDPSPNLRWIAIRWYEDGVDDDVVPELAELWPRTRRDWLRVALMKTMVEYYSWPHANEFLRYAPSVPEEYVSEVIEALGELRHPGAIDVIGDFVEHRNEEIRSTAIRTLRLWPWSRKARVILLDLTHSTDDPTRRLATGALSRFFQGEVTARLMDLAGDRSDFYVRLAAVESLRDRDHPAMLPILQRILATQRLDSHLYEAAYLTLVDLEENSADPAVGAYLASVREPEEDSVLGCGGSGTDFEAPALRISPPGGDTTARCWSIPGRQVLLEMEWQSREDAADPVQVSAHFEIDGELWVAIDYDECWLPRSHLSWATGSETISDDLYQAWYGDLDYYIECEINDIPVSELESRTAQMLLDAGFLSLFDPLEDIIGAEITVTTESYEECFSLLETYDTDETFLGRMVYDLLDWCYSDLDEDDPRWETFEKLWETVKYQLD